MTSRTARQFDGHHFNANILTPANGQKKVTWQEKVDAPTDHLALCETFLDRLAEEGEMDVRTLHASWGLDQGTIGGLLSPLCSPNPTRGVWRTDHGCVCPPSTWCCCIVCVCVCVSC